MPDAGAAPPAPSEWSQKKESVHVAQAGIPLLRDIPPLLLDLVLARINLITLSEAEVVFREGSEGSSVYFVVEGTLEERCKDDLGNDVPLRTVRRGDSVERDVLPHRMAPHRDRHGHGEDRPARARPQRARPDRPQAPALADALNRLHTERVLLGALARSPVFAFLSDGDRRAVARRLRTLSVKAGTRIVVQGGPQSGVYLLDRGALRVTVRAGDRETAVALLEPHQLFGDLVPRRVPAQIETVTAVGEAELLWLSAEDLSVLRARSSAFSDRLDGIQLQRLRRSQAAQHGAT